MNTIARGAIFSGISVGAVLAIIGILTLMAETQVP